MSRIRNYLVGGAAIGASIGVLCYVLNGMVRSGFRGEEISRIHEEYNLKRETLQQDPEVSTYINMLDSIVRQEDTPYVLKRYAELLDDPEVKQLRAACVESRTKIDELVLKSNPPSLKGFSVFGASGAGIGTMFGAGIGIVMRRREPVPMLEIEIDPERTRGLRNIWTND